MSDPETPNDDNIEVIEERFENAANLFYQTILTLSHLQEGDSEVVLWAMMSAMHRHLVEDIEEEDETALASLQELFLEFQKGHRLVMAEKEAMVNTVPETDNKLKN